MSKKILSAVLAVMMVLALVPMTVLATSEENTAITTYTQLAEAVSAAEDGAIIKLDADIEETTKVETQVKVENKSITLDLNGHDLKAYPNGLGYTLVVGQDPAEGKKATLRIINTSDTKATIDNSHPTSTTVEANNGGTLILGNDDGSASNFVIANTAHKTTDWNSAIKVEEQGALKVYGGEILTPVDNVQEETPKLRSVQTLGMTEIYGGSFAGEIQVWRYQDNESNLTIEGGTFKKGVVICSIDDASWNYGGEVSINGGTFDGEDDESTKVRFGIVPYAQGVNTAAATFEVSGGTFTCDNAEQVEDYLAPGIALGDDGTAKPTGDCAYSNISGFLGGKLALSQLGSESTYVLQMAKLNASGTVTSAYVASIIETGNEETTRTVYCLKNEAGYSVSLYKVKDGVVISDDTDLGESLVPVFEYKECTAAD